MRPATFARLAPTILCAGLAAAPATPVAAAPGKTVRPRTGKLSAQLAELASPPLREASLRAQTRALATATLGSGSLLRDGERVVVEVRFDRGAAARAGELQGSGAEVLDVNRRYQTVTVAALPADLTELARVPGVTAVTEVLTPVAAASTCPSGAAVSEGDVQLRAAEARSAFGVDGAGVKVGILSDSFDQDASAETDAAEDAESGDLPGPGNTCPGQSAPVDVLEDFVSPKAADEGRAMAQIVHDLAPGAQISFATAFTGMIAFAGNIEDLAAAGADVIADDVFYFEEPFFQEGPVGVAVGNVTEAGVSYFSSAGNNNLIDGLGRNFASWEAPAFRDGACPTGLPAYTHHCMDFDPGGGVDTTFGLTVSAGVTLNVDLQWAQPWEGVTTDLDAYLLDSSDTVVKKSERFNVALTQSPFELLEWKNTTGSAQTVRIAINRCDVASCDPAGGDSDSPRLKLALMQNGGGVTESEYPEASGGDVVGPAIFGHNGAAGAVSVGAVRYDTSSAPEAFSSHGPVTHYFGPVSGSGAAAPLPTPVVLPKPDVAATDGGANTFFGFFDGTAWRFFGTSAAAPHAAALAALLRDRNPTLAPEEIRTALADSALPVGLFGPDAVGAGLVDALGALGEVAEPGPGEEEPPGGGTQPPVAQSPASVSQPGRAQAARPPATFFRRRPAKVLRTAGPTARAVFVFASDQADATFLCRLDRRPFRTCARRVLRRVAPGTHVMRVKARDAAGRTDPTPAVYRFRVERVR